MKHFYIGQKVVCINGNWHFLDKNGNKFIDNTNTLMNLRCPNLPIKDKIYTIREIKKDFLDKLSLRFEEIVNPTWDGFALSGTGFLEPGFDSKCFRPLEEKKTDISIFTSLPMDKITYTPHKTKTPQHV